MTLELLSLHCFNTLAHIGPRTLAKIKAYGSEELWFRGTYAIFQEVLQKEQIGFYEQFEKINRDVYLRSEQKYLEDHSIGLLSLGIDQYPKSLEEISVPPVLLYLKGNIPDLTYGLAIIGTRKYSSYGEQVCFQLSKDLSSMGIPIISGLALGIDSIAHKGCIEGGSPTIAVLGGGLDESVLYPKSNRELSNRILQNGGCLVSEFPPLYPPRKESFPMRNRIVSGLAKGVLVIEAPRKSGTMLTVEYALQQNKDVFAIPGNITSKNSEGTNYLLQQGAYVVTKPEDITHVFGVEHTFPEISLHSFEVFEQDIIKSLLSRSLTMEQIATQTGYDFLEIMTKISLLELAGVVITDATGVCSLQVRIKNI